MTQSGELPGVSLVLGGARSGKSRWAENLAASGAGAPVYLATAEARDREMRERIERHRERRGELWRTIEEPVDIREVLARERAPDRVVLVDCLTLWLSNLMAAERDVENEIERLLRCLDDPAGPIVFVSNEVGMGIVPTNELARNFRDHAGLLNQKVAAKAALVVFIAAGLPLSLKAPPGWKYPPSL
jgi:adenosylcobinamide kinase/adenosylcobinamide-phosphate guanylyltransferase